MNQFGLLSIGLLFGILISLFIASTVVLAYISWRTRSDTLALQQQSTLSLRRNTAAINTMREEVRLALAAMDATKLHDASISIQGLARQLTSSVSLFHRLVLAGTEGDESARATVPIIPPEAVDAAVASGLGSYNEMDENFVGSPTPAAIQLTPEQGSIDPLQLWSLKQQSRLAERERMARMQDQEVEDTERADLDVVAEEEMRHGKPIPVSQPEQPLDLSEGYEADDNSELP